MTRIVSIRSIGLEEHLDSTRHKHNMFGYIEFKRLYVHNVNPTNIAKAFSVDRRTILKWIDIFREEEGFDRV